MWVCWCEKNFLNRTLDKYRHKLLNIIKTWWYNWFLFHYSSYRRWKYFNILYLHWWSSGTIVPCHGTDPGSIPDQYNAYESKTWNLLDITLKILHLLWNVKHMESTNYLITWALCESCVENVGYNMGTKQFYREPI